MEQEIQVIEEKEEELTTIFEDTINVYPELEDIEVTPTSIEQEFTHPNSYGYDNVKVKAVASDDLEITPTTNAQQYVGLYGKVDVNAVDNTIDNNIQSNNIKTGVTILGITGNVDELIPEEINVTPTTSSQTITPSANKTGITQVNVSAVDSSIDSDIVSSNIRQGVDILGVEGTVVELKGEERETTPTEQTQVITPSENKNGITQMTVNPIPSEYIIPTGTKTITENGITNVKNYENANVNVPPTPIEEKDVNFYDYDGTLLYSFTTQEALELESLPDLPSKAGLVCQGWNFTLSEMKNYATNVGWVDVGAVYITDDGHTRLYMHLTDPDLLEMPFDVKYIENGQLNIDWGDGTSDIITVAGLTSHTYQLNSFPADVMIDIEYTGTGVYSLGQNNPFNDTQYFSSCLVKLELGSGHDYTLGNAYEKYTNCVALKTVTIPDGTPGLGLSLFRECASLKCVVVPRSCTVAGQYTFDGCRSLENLIFPDTITTGSTNICSNLVGAKHINYPQKIDASLSTSFFSSCMQLKKVKLPNNITSIGNQVFGSCYSLEYVNVPTSLRTMGTGVFIECRNLKEITLPDTVTDIGSQQCFNGCWSVPYLKIPSGVTSIGSYTFQNCKSLYELDFSDHTSVPTLVNVNAFTGTPTTQKIYVKDQAMLNAFSTASNWTNFASRFQIKP